MDIDVWLCLHAKRHLLDPAARVPIGIFVPFGILYRDVGLRIQQTASLGLQHTHYNCAALHVCAVVVDCQVIAVYLCRLLSEICFV